MSVNFNLAMLRSLQQPIEDSLENTIAQLSQYVAGTLAPADFDAVQHIHLAAGSLTVIGCQAAARLANALEVAAAGLARPERRGWTASKAQDVARASLVLAQGLLNHLRALLADEEDVPVRLWPAWQALSNAMEEPPYGPEELFEPAADFEDLHFAQLADDYLKDVTDGMIRRIEAVIDNLSGDLDPQQTANALREALKVFDWAYGLRHGRGYQAYWLALRARLSIGLMGEPEALADRAQWNVLLREALLETHKFSRNARRVHPELLMKTLRPMLARWPAHWTGSHPTLSEASRRLGFADFWDALDEIKSANLALPGPVPVNEDQQALLAQLKQDWSHYVAGEGSDIRMEMEKGMALLAARRSSFDAPWLDPLFDEMALVAAQLPAPGHVPEEIALEFAAAVLLLEDAVERRFRPAPSSAAQATLSHRRLSAARQGQLRELHLLPPLRWDTKRVERQVRMAHVAIFTEIHKDLLIIEEALAERLRDEASPLDLQQLRATASLASAVLRSVECHGAAAVVDGIARLASDNPSPEALSALTLGVAGLGAYLNARENGDAEADHLLQAAHQAVVGKPLPTGTLSEDEWRRTQKPIEEHVAAPLSEAAMPAMETIVSTVVEPEAEPEQDAVDEGQAFPVPTPAVPAFRPELLLSPGGYEEMRRGVPIEAFFLEEMGQVLEEIQIQRGVLAHDPADEEARATLRRQFHTIKGSGRLAGFHGLGELGYHMEARLTQDMETSPAYGRAVDQLVERACAQFEQWFAQLRANETAVLDGLTFQQWLDHSRAAQDAIPLDQAEVDQNRDIEQDAPAVALETLDLGASTPWPAVAPEQGESQADVDPALVDDAAAEPVEALVDDAAAEPVEVLVEDAQPVTDEVSTHGAESIRDAAPAEQQSDAVKPLPIIVEVEGLGRMDQESYDLLVSDLDRYRPILAAAASAKADELIDVEPIHRAAHTSGSLGATLGMRSLALLGRAFEHYAERLLQGHPHAHAPWTELGQEASEALWMLLDDLVERQRLSGFDEGLLTRLSAASASLPQTWTSVFDELATAQDGDRFDLNEAAAELIEPAASLEGEDGESAVSLEDENGESAAGTEVASQTEAAPAVLPAAASLIEAATPPGQQVIPQEEPMAPEQMDDEQLWEEMLDSLATISAQIRRLGPVLAILSERRR